MPISRSTDSHMITVSQAPLLESLSENIEIGFASETTSELPLADAEVVVEDQPETSTNCNLKRSSTCIEMQKLLQAFKDYQNEINAQDGRWSEEARRRYLEYQKVWSKFRNSRNMH